MSDASGRIAAPLIGLRAAGESHVGKVRKANEDSMIVDPIRGLYVVLDGMGGANAGDVASQTARDAIRELVIEQRGKLEPKALLDAAIQRGSAAVFEAASASPGRAGMGTTCVGCLVVDAQHAVVGHVGDSRAYLLRNGRLMALTRDHTIVQELVERGLLAPEEAERHPYKNVLSRNLGAKPDAKVDVVEVEIKPGDRIMLCSDGLYGFASAEGIQYLLGSGDEPQHVARDLIELALRGGGGDNVTAIVIEAPAAAPTSTQVVRTSGAIAWWQRRQRFVQVVDERGLAKNPICRGLSREEAIDLIAMSLCQAVFHDLEKSTGVNVWTFTQNVAGGWFERGGEWQPLRELLDLLGAAARAVVDDIRAQDGKLAALMDVAVGRALVVGELAVGGLLSERLGRVDAQLVQLHARAQAIHETQHQPPPLAIPTPLPFRATSGSGIARDSQPSIPHSVIDDGLATVVDLAAASGSYAALPADTTDQFVELATMPFVRADRAASVADADAEVLAAIGKAITVARARTSPRAELVKQILGALEQLAPDALVDEPNLTALAQQAAHAIYGVRPVDDTGVMPLFDALDQARLITAASVHQITAPDAVRAKALRAISAAHQRLVGATTLVVLAAVRPYSQQLREAQSATFELRSEVARNERKRAELETKLASSLMPDAPDSPAGPAGPAAWAKRGTTEW